MGYKRAKWPAQPPSNWNRKAHASLSAILHIPSSPTSCWCDNLEHRRWTCFQAPPGPCWSQVPSRKQIPGNSDITSFHLACYAHFLVSSCVHIVHIACSGTQNTGEEQFKTGWPFETTAPVFIWLMFPKSTGLSISTSLSNVWWIPTRTKTNLKTKQNPKKHNSHFIFLWAWMLQLERNRIESLSTSDIG